MSAHSASAFNPTTEPVTPVIVKVGGDDNSDANVPRTSSPVNIDSPGLSFAETVPGLKWVSSLSTSAGRINNVIIQDGSSNPISQTVTPGSDLASVTINFGPTRLIAMESGVPDNDVFLLITSPEVPFNVVQSGDWKTSGTTFLGRIRSVVLMVGDKEILHHDFQSEDATVQIDFNLNNPN